MGPPLPPPLLLPARDDEEAPDDAPLREDDAATLDEEPDPDLDDPLAERLEEEPGPVWELDVPGWEVPATEVEAWEVFVAVDAPEVEDMASEEDGQCAEVASEAPLDEAPD